MLRQHHCSHMTGTCDLYCPSLRPLRHSISHYSLINTSSHHGCLCSLSSSLELYFHYIQTRSSGAVIVKDNVCGVWECEQHLLTVSLVPAHTHTHTHVQCLSHTPALQQTTGSSGLWGGGPSSASDSLWPCYSRLESDGGEVGGRYQRATTRQRVEMMRPERGRRSTTVGVPQSGAAHGVTRRIVNKICAIAPQAMNCGGIGNKIK